MSKQSSTESSLLSTNTLIFLGVVWALVALLFFLFFSVPPPGEEQPDWYFVGITLLETGAFFMASLLCLRNWQSGQIVSGRNVWGLISLGLLCYTAGNVLFYLWGNVWGLDPAVSLGDVFYLLCYVFLAIGMLQAVLPRRLNLEIQQWVIVAVIGISGVVLAIFLNFQPGSGGDAAMQPVESSPALPAVAPAVISSGHAPLAITVSDAPAATDSATVDPSTAAPAWAQQLDTQLADFEPIVSLLYVVGDCLLLVVAATLLVAFWGGRFSQSWKLIAIAAFCLYIADMCFAYYVNQSDYQEGSLWEVFWTFSAVFFGLGAAVEHAISSRSRRTPRRRRA